MLGYQTSRRASSYVPNGTELKLNSSIHDNNLRDTLTRLYLPRVENRWAHRDKIASNVPMALAVGESENRSRITLEQTFTVSSILNAPRYTMIINSAVYRNSSRGK